jgi:hypothetical protein
MERPAATAVDMESNDRCNHGKVQQRGIDLRPKQNAYDNIINAQDQKHYHVIMNKKGLESDAVLNQRTAAAIKIQKTFRGYLV